MALPFSGASRISYRHPRQRCEDMYTVLCKTGMLVPKLAASLSSLSLSPSLYVTAVLRTMNMAPTAFFFLPAVVRQLYVSLCVQACPSLTSASHDPHPPPSRYLPLPLPPIDDIVVVFIARGHHTRLLPGRLFLFACVYFREAHVCVRVCVWVGCTSRACARACVCVCACVRFAVGHPPAHRLRHSSLFFRFPFHFFFVHWSRVMIRLAEPRACACVGVNCFSVPSRLRNRSPMKGHLHEV